MTLALAVVLIGCWRPPTFMPTARINQRAPVVNQAMEIYRGDVESLLRAGAVWVGTLYTDGSPHRSFPLSSEAARHGGTHFLVGASKYKTRVVQLTNETCRTTGTATTTALGGTFAAQTECQSPIVVGWTDEVATALVFHVEPRRIAELPTALRVQLRRRRP